MLLSLYKVLSPLTSKFAQLKQPIGLVNLVSQFSIISKWQTYLHICKHFIFDWISLILLYSITWDWTTYLHITPPTKRRLAEKLDHLVSHHLVILNCPTYIHCVLSTSKMQISIYTTHLIICLYFHSSPTCKNNMDVNIELLGQYLESSI